MCQISKLIFWVFLVLISSCTSQQERHKPKKTLSQPTPVFKPEFEDTSSLSKRPFNDYLEAMELGDEMEIKLRLSEVIPDDYQDVVGLRKFLRSEFEGVVNPLDSGILDSYALIIEKLKMTDFIPLLVKEVSRTEKFPFYTVVVIYNMDSRSLQQIQDNLLTRFPEFSDWMKKRFRANQ